MLRAAALTVTCAALALAGCGGAASSGEGDPASLVPAGAAFYVQSAVQPQDERRDDALAAAGKILQTDDPGGRLRELVDEALAEKGDGLTWERDFAPWLGEDGGLWLSDLAAEEPSYAVILAAKDADAAAAALPRLQASAADGGRRVTRSHDGIEYAVDEEGEATGLVDDFLVVADEAAFKRVVDTHDGDSLAESDRYRDAIDELEDERLGHYFLDPRPLVDAALREDPQAARQFEQFRSFLRMDELGPIVGSLQADAAGIRLDTVMTELPDGPLRRLGELWSGGETELLGELPGDAWVAFATPDLGEGLETLFSSFAGALGAAALSAQVQRSTGLNLQQDVFSWMGDAGLFVRGAREADLDGALVIEATDDGRAATAFGKLVGVLAKESGAPAEPLQLEGAESAFSIAVPDAPQPFVLARAPGRVVAAYGRPAAVAALAPAAKLGDGEAFGAAEEILGDDFAPALVLSVPAVLELVEASAERDPDFERAKPYLEAFGTLTSGGSADGDTVRSRVAVTLK